MKSILNTSKDRCFICGRRRNIEKHHIFYGPLRPISEANGFTVYLCHYCHNEPPDGVHHNIDNDTKLKILCQTEYEKTHSRAEFMALIHKNYREA